MSDSTPPLSDTKYDELEAEMGKEYLQHLHMRIAELEQEIDKYRHTVKLSMWVIECLKRGYNIREVVDMLSNAYHGNMENE